jgi:hypothetical protein
MRTFNSVHKKCLSLLHRMDYPLNTLFAHISCWVNEVDTYSTFPIFPIKRLQSLCRVWVKNRDVVEQQLSAILPLTDEPNASSGDLLPIIPAS